IRDKYDFTQIQYLITGLSVSEAVCRRIKIPFSGSSQIKQTVKYEVESLLPFPLEDALINVYPIGGHSDGQTELLVFCVRKKSIKEHLKILNEEGFEPRAVYLDVISVFNLLSALEKSLPEAGLLINIGASKMNICFFSGGKIQFVRALPRAGIYLTQSIAQELKIDFKEAEELKKSKDVFISENNQGAAGEELVSGILTKAVDRLKIDIKQTIALSADMAEDRIQKIFLTGGSVQLKGLPEYLNKQLGLEVEVFNPLDHYSHRLSPEDSAISVSSATVLGLANSGLGGASQDLDLRKEEFIYRPEFERIKKPVLIAGFMAALFFFIFIAGLHLKAHILDTRYKELKKQTRQVFKETFPEVKRVVHEIQQAKVKLKEIKEKTNIFEGILKKEGSTLELLREISLKITKQLPVKIYSLNIDAGQIKLSGRVASYENLEQLKQKLLASDYLKTVKIDSAALTQEEKDKGVEFRLSIGVLK
ncbi:MAG: pilus assembly protein PilM, partial [Candidatus Omnitrophica bacterium]|nr:pilus assembly protein PilM [Candidatus Omnitrophota bacterium]